MAHCYQKVNRLEECSICLETCLEHAGDLPLKDQSVGQRIAKLKLECKTRMQLCAILSQLHRHKEALENAQLACSLASLICQEQLALCEFFS